MPNFRLVLLDNAKKQLHKSVAQKTLSDLILIKQKNFERTDPDYIVVDKHDMVGTHLLIYETSNLFEPKLIFALRLTYEDRAKKHKIKTPLQDLIPQLDSKCQKAYLQFQRTHAVVADCNSWFVDPDFSLKSSGLRLSDIGYTMAFLQVRRLGINNLIGCTNEKYKAHRWLENIGTFEKGYDFIHPIIADPHMLVLLDKFNVSYIQSVYEAHKTLFDNLLEISSDNEIYKNISETIRDNFLVPWEGKKAG